MSANGPDAKRDFYEKNKNPQRVSIFENNSKVGQKDFYPSFSTPPLPILLGGPSFKNSLSYVIIPSPTIPTASVLSALTVTHSREGRSKPLHTVFGHKRSDGEGRRACYPASLL